MGDGLRRFVGFQGGVGMHQRLVSRSKAFVRLPRYSYMFLDELTSLMKAILNSGFVVKRVYVISRTLTHRVVKR